MFLPHNSTVSVSDGRSIKVFRNAGTDINPRLEPEADPQLVAAGHGSGGRHHSSTANPDAHQLDEDSYAASVAHWLNSEVLAGRIEHLVVVAPPRTLGEMRLHFHEELRKRLLTEIAREMSQSSATELLHAITEARSGE